MPETPVSARKAGSSAASDRGWRHRVWRGVAPNSGQILLAMALGVSAIGGWAQEGQAGPSRGEADTGTAVSTTNDPGTLSGGSVPTEPSYVIGVGDMLQVSVWKEPDLTTTLPVRADGMISVPLLDDVQASGFTPMQLAALIKEKLRKYVADPRVTVVVTRTDSHRIYVLGEVLHTGPISLLHKMTVLQALATAGLSEYANTRKIYVLRTNNGQEQRIPFDYKRVIRGEVASQNIVLEPGDMIVVP